MLWCCFNGALMRLLLIKWICFCTSSDISCFYPSHCRWEGQELELAWL
ncbi:hypothetical protein KC19_5G100300 [Ceratodon purpureus]|uniref:Uncharacterized protein n=1 Tax=Ceratodon purpureus TaxID=3225 RepID=A0A8T0I202_CERPU|nr:hypothetical protein KC19_5G100300 [Ceratodon purpureus]